MQGLVFKTGVRPLCLRSFFQQLIATRTFCRYPVGGYERNYTTICCDFGKNYPNSKNAASFFENLRATLTDVEEVFLGLSRTNLCQAGQQQVALSVENLTRALADWADVREDVRKHLLENLAVVSREASASPEQRKMGLLKSSLSFLTASVGAANNLIPLVHDLHEKLKIAGVIDW